MRVRFWGTRGSIARPGPGTLRYGGNTSCVEVRSDDGSLVVLDCGTGAHEFAQHMRRSGDIPRRGHLLIGHTHWDHIQGFPFFEPLFMSDGEWDLFGPSAGRRNLEDALKGQMEYEYHPIALPDIDGKVIFHDLTEGVFDCGSIRVTTRYLNHPALTLGYRLEADGASVVYATDHEPRSLYPLDGTPGSLPMHHEDRRHVEFLSQADLVIHDAQYTMSEFPDRAGWGHTPVERAVDYAIGARVSRLALFHHDPGREDPEVDEIVESARKRAALGSHVPDVFAASEGTEIELPRRPEAVHSPIVSGEAALLSRVPRRASTVLIVEDDPEIVKFLRMALDEERVRLLEARDGETAVALAEAEQPSLVLLDLNLPLLDGMEVCRRLRASAKRRVREMPVLILTGMRRRQEDVANAFLAGATDYLTKPIKPTLLRAVVRGWLMRTRPD